MAIDDDTGSSQGTGAVEPRRQWSPPLPPSAAPVPSELARPYRSPARLATVTRVLLVAVVALTAATMAACVVEWQLVGEVASSDISRLEDIDDRRRVLGGTVLVALATSFVTFILVIRRLYRNLRPLGIGGLRFSEGWAVGAWFVPFLNLVRPKQIVDDIWRAGEPTTGPVRSWLVNPVSWLLHVWWGAWIVAMLVARGAAGEPADLDDVRSVLAWEVAWVSLLGASALVTVLVVVQLTERQSRFAAARGVLAPSPGRGRRSVLVDGLLPLALGVGTFTAVYVLPDDVARPADGRTVAELEIADCFLIPTVAADERVDLEVVDVVPCSSPHDGEAFATVTHPAAIDVSFPGDEALEDFALDRCVDEFEPAIGVAAADSSLGIAVIWPSGSWSDGDRTIVCLTGIDGERLDRSVLGSGL